MLNLQQAVYEDGDGHPVEAAKVQALAPYVHIADGFYNWTCGACGTGHSDRWWNISGRVLPCHGCKKLNLLVRTNCTEITEALSGQWQSKERDEENEKLRGIVKFNDEKVQEIRRGILRTVEEAVSQAAKGFGNDH
jgi:hypothetical protein